MSFKDLDRVLKNSPNMYFDDNSKIVFMSDMHRNDGTRKDNLIINWNIYKSALNYYYKNGFTYFELGDGDELWESDIFSVYEANEDLFKILNKFKLKSRLVMIYGNHDKIKGSKNFSKYIIKKSKYNDKSTFKAIMDFYKDLQIYEGINLINKSNNYNMLLTHGHQVDFLSNELSFVSKFMVRHLWSFLESVCGFRAPTSPANKRSKQRHIDKLLSKWVRKNDKMLIAGHTHRMRMPYENEGKYFNDGCGVKPHYISTLELVNGAISLIKWKISSNDNYILYIKREVLIGPINLKAYKKL